MAALPSPTQVAGSSSAIYEGYYNVVDPNGFGSVGGMEAARFLKRSGLSDVILSKIWDLSDPGGRGCLDKAGIFVALKLVALVQNGKDLNISNVTMDVPPPKMGDIILPKPTKTPPPTNTHLINSSPSAPSPIDWTIKPAEKEKYYKLFDSLQPLNGLIPGNKVKNVLMESKLPFETLGKIWDLADQDKDGMLNRHEFLVAMHLVYKALENYAIPSKLPSELMEPPEKNLSTPLDVSLVNHGVDGIKQNLLQNAITTQPIAPSDSIKPVQQISQKIPWVVMSEEKAKSDMLFIKSDIDKDGFVSGQEIKDVFLQSGVPQPVLAHIWALCDIKQNGKLNNEQFALAMWLVARCLKGIEPPVVLTSEMIPPSFRSTQTSDGFAENNNIRFSNPELDMITKDIEELSKEKLALETDITQKEADMKIKSGEIKNLQSELDTLAATLKQLENQKGEAQKRLNDLKTQVDKLRIQASEQAESVKAQEMELNSKKEQFEVLCQEEQRLEKQKLESIKKLDSLTTNLQGTQFCISQAKALTTQLQEQTRQMNDAVLLCDTAIELGNAAQIPDTALVLKAEFKDSAYHKLLLINGNTFEENEFDDDDAFSNSNRISHQTDPFKNGLFKTTDGFSKDPFKALEKSENGFTSDPFDETFSSNAGETDPFSNSQKNCQIVEEGKNKDPFGCDPFAVLHAPTRDGTVARSTSPSPALPPKKSKQPPPRPAPPRPSQPPSVKRNSQSDSFDNEPFGPNDGFADFSNFDAKFTNKFTMDSRARPTKSLDFTDDPFRDYHYEDPFSISFDEEPILDENKKSTPVSSDVTASQIKDKFDPFNFDGRHSEPLPNSDFFISDSGRASAPINFGLLNEKEQLAWAAQEGLKLEEDRKKRQLQEEADLELAISLSKAES